MPALLEDPNNANIPGPRGLHTMLETRSCHLRDRVTSATIYPIFSLMQLPPSLLMFLLTELNNEIQRGDTYPMEEVMSVDQFKQYWFGNFAAIMLRGDEPTIRDGRDWSKNALGTFYVKPNYPGRCSHVCSAGFIVTKDARAQGVGKLLAEAYLDYAPKLGYTYSVFNLVFETNTASLKIWDTLGFKRIGRIKGAARLEGHENKVDAIIYGRDLGDDEEYVSDERFDKIKYYLEKGKYPPTANRSEKSRLRSAATHYRLENDKLMLKDKQVISDPQEQYEIARGVHMVNHGGINKTTANIAEKYHWVQIKKTVSQVIKNCADCKEHAKPPSNNNMRAASQPKRTSPPPQQEQLSPPGQHHHQLAQAIQSQHEAMAVTPLAQAQAQGLMMHNLGEVDIPVDPAMMDDVQQHMQHNLTANLQQNLQNMQMPGGLTPSQVVQVAQAQMQMNPNMPNMPNVNMMGLVNDMSTDPHSHQTNIHALQHHLHQQMQQHGHHMQGHELMLTAEEEDQQRRHQSTAAAAVQALTDGYGGQHDLQRLVAELKGYSDTGHDAGDSMG